MQIRSPKIAFIICALVWALVQGMLLYNNGIITSNEATKYIGQAYHLIQDGKLDDHKYIFYFIPILCIYISLQLHTGFVFAIALQLVINAVATILFYKIAMRLFGHTFKCILAVLFYITFIPIQEWNTYLYTESLFYSLCVFFMYACIVLPRQKRTTHIVRIIILLLLLFTRPLGLLFIPVLFFMYITESKISRLAKGLIVLAIPVVLYFLINFLYSSNADMDILMPQQQGMVICYGGENISGSNVVFPTTKNPSLNILLFVVKNPVYFFKLASLRVLSFFDLYRHEYSAAHNAYLVVNMLLLYSLTIIALVKGGIIKKASAARIFYLLLIMLCAGVMVQCNDYDSRFSMPLFPWLILFATDGLFSFRSKSSKPPFN